MTTPNTGPDHEQGGECACGSPDATSLLPAEVVVHRSGGCYIAANEQMSKSSAHPSPLVPDNDGDQGSSKGGGR